MYTLGDVFPIIQAANNKISVYSVSRDAFHRETKSLLLEDIPARITSGSVRERPQHPERPAEPPIYRYRVYVPAVKSEVGEIKLGDVVVFDGEEHRVIDIYKGYTLNGVLNFVRLDVV